MKKTLSIRTSSPEEAANPRQNWGVSPERLERLRDNARTMRRNPTEPENALWDRLQGQRLGGFKFQRKLVVGSAITDFACPARWLVVEVDGDAYDTPAIDALRDRKLTEVGLRVLRFSAEAVLGDIEAVLAAIRSELEKPFEKSRQGASPLSSLDSEEDSPDEAASDLRSPPDDPLESPETVQTEDPFEKQEHAE